jgi:hypothetical protein
LTLPLYLIERVPTVLPPVKEWILKFQMQKKY